MFPRPSRSDPSNDVLMSRSIVKCLKTFNKKVHPSLYPLLFPRHLCALPEKLEVEAEDLPNEIQCSLVAGILIRMAAFYFQARYIHSRRDWGPESEYQSRAFFLEKATKALWGGADKLSVNTCTSIIKESNTHPVLNPERKMISNVRSLDCWNDFLEAHVQDDIKQFLRLADQRQKDEVSLYVGLTDFIEGFPLFEKLEVDLSRDLVSFVCEGVTYGAFPFLWKELPAESGVDIPVVVYLFSFREWEESEHAGLVYKDILGLGRSERVEVRREMLESANSEALGGAVQYVDLVRRELGNASLQNPIHLYLFGGKYEYIESLCRCLVMAPGAAADLASNTFEEELGETQDDDLSNRFLFLLLSKGPVKVLERIFEGAGKQVDRALNEYLKELALYRSLKKDEIDMIKSKRASLLKKADAYLEQHHPEDMREETRRQLRVNLAVWAVMKACGLDPVDPVIEPRSLRRRRKEFSSIRDEIESQGRTGLAGSMLNASKVVEKVLYFLNLFYAGLPGYYYSMQKAEKRRQKGKARGKEWNPERHEQEMLERAEEYRDKVGLDKLSLGQRVGALRQVWKDRQVVEAAHYLLGRDMEESCHFLALEALDKACRIRNDFAHDVASLADAEEFMDVVDVFFDYLQFGRDYVKLERSTNSGKRLRRGRAIIERPIYPRSIVFEETRTNHLNIQIHTYGFFAREPKTKHEHKIHIITRYTLKEREYHYCIPKEEGASQSYWIEPFLIRCRDFDALLERGKR